MSVTLDRSNWQRVTFGDLVVNVNNYYRPEVDGVLPYVAGPHINPGEVTVATYGSTDDDQFPPTFKRKFAQGDVLLHSRGIEKLAAVDRVGVTGEKLFVLRTKDESKLKQEFLVWLLLGPAAQGHMRDNFTGSVNKFLNWKPLAAMELLLPGLDDQKRIADLLWAVERHREAAREVADAVRAVRARWRESLFERPVDSTRLDRVAEVTLGRQRAPQHAAGDHMRDYVRSANITNDGVSLADIKQMNFTPAEQAKFRLVPGDVLVSEGTASARELGSSATWQPEERDHEMYFQKTLLRLRARSGLSTSLLLQEWARWAQESGAFVGVATGTGILHITGVRCAAMPFPVWTRGELSTLDQYAAQLGGAERASSDEPLTLAHLKSCLLADIFGGV